jgi:mannose-6-phosphate isomerase-like protein (cupin superfamily)
VADYTLKRIGEMEAIFGGSFHRARAELGVTSFGMQVFDMPAHADRYPEHDHSHDGQEEVYLVLRGSAEVVLDGDERVRIDPETPLRVGPSTRRKIVTGDQPARILAIGGIPGRAYEVAGFTELGAPDPMAS